MSLFPPDPESQPARPLADRMRPRSLDEIAGQDALVGPDGPLRRAAETGRLHSMILWGPPGSGKTTLARILADAAGATFVSLSAVLSGVRDVRRVMEEARARARAGGGRTVLFIDEIHRFNKAQQDAFLPFVEQGTLIFVGATTENPSFEVTPALLSRCRVYRLEPLNEDALLAILRRALSDPERGLGARRVEIGEDLLRVLARRSRGDARAALNALELAVQLGRESGEGVQVDDAAVSRALQRQVLYHDKAGDAHYDLVSALQKSMRSSDPDASLYWLGRLLEAGEDPMAVARRIVRTASEDVGLADPRALELAMAARDAMHFLGRPEGDLALAEAVVYIALAPKSNALETAWGQVLEAIRSGGAEPVPLRLRNAPTGLMRAQGFGDGYIHAHDEPDAVGTMECLPDALAGRRFYRPALRGFERRLQRRLDAWRARRETRRGAPAPPSSEPPER